MPTLQRHPAHPGGRVAHDFDVPRPRVSPPGRNNRPLRVYCGRVHDVLNWVPNWRDGGTSVVRPVMFFASLSLPVDACLHCIYPFLFFAIYVSLDASHACLPACLSRR